MENFLKDNEDILFHLKHLDIDRVISLREDNFAEKLLELANDPERLGEMKSRMKEIAIPDASDRVCDVIAARLAR